MIPGPFSTWGFNKNLDERFHCALFLGKIAIVHGHTLSLLWGEHLFFPFSRLHFPILISDIEKRNECFEFPIIYL